MIVKQILDEDFVNYKKPSFFIAFPNCSFKCEKECGTNCCQNSGLAKQKNIEIEADKLVKRYIGNIYTNAVVLGGLEPFDSWNDLVEFVRIFRRQTNDDVVIYTGYNKEEVEDKIGILSSYKNIIIKFGRFIPNQLPHFDNVLGVMLQSPNQYAERIC